MEKAAVFLALCMMPFILQAADQIVINEIMYNSNGTDVEFIEIVNVSGASINLSGWNLLDDNDAHKRCPLAGTLAADAYLVVVGDKASFAALYPNAKNVNTNDFNPNNTGWSLGNGGDTVRLFNASGAVHDSVAYLDANGWPGSPDGGGPSLELLHPSLDNNLAASWDPSLADGGTPGVKNSVYTTNVPPVCKDGERNIPLPKNSDNVKITVLAYDLEGLAKVELLVNSGAGYQTFAMSDNGANGDDVAGDSLYTATIPAKTSGTLVKYYAAATDNIGQTDLWPNNAPSEYHAYTVDYTPPNLRINEVVAVNNSIIADEAGEYDDWFEIYNAGTTTVNLRDMYVSDLINSNLMFKLPNFTLAAGAYLLLWADNDTDQGPLHTNFQLSSEGESIALFETVDHGNVLVHGWKYGRLSGNVSMGFKTKDATAPDYLATPTPQKENISNYFSNVCINEFQSTSDFGGPDDWIEMYNRGAAPVNVSNCFLSDERGNNTKWQFPDDTILQPGQFLVIWEDELGFGLSSDGIDVIMFTAPDSLTGLDFYDFDQQQADWSEGRKTDGGSVWRRFKPPTRGVSNENGAAVSQNNATPPVTFELLQNYPNPFNPITTIAFTLPQSDRVTLKIFDLLGRHVSTLVDEKLTAGLHSYEWNAENFASGIYFFSLTWNGESQIKKMQLIK